MNRARRSNRLSLTSAANPPVPQTRGAYTDLAPPGQPMHLQGVCPAERRIEPWRQRHVAHENGVGGDVNVSGKEK
jgi:hypothetical protein